MMPMSFTQAIRWFETEVINLQEAEDFGHDSLRYKAAKDQYDNSFKRLQELHQKRCTGAVSSGYLSAKTKYKGKSTTPTPTVSQDRAVERFYIDCEFDGHNGPLLSIAIVGDHTDGIYIRTTARAKDDWVAANVEPLMDRHRAPETAIVRVGQVGGVIRAFMGNMDGATIIADSPVDITRFCQAITTDADGNWASVDGNLKFEVHDISCYPTELPDAVQHNAWWDAMALRHKLAAFKKSEVGHG